MTGTFDPTQVLNATYDEANSTQIIPVPEGDYQGVIAQEPEFRVNQRKDGTGNILFMDIRWELSAPEIAELTGRNPLTVRQSIIVDTTPSGGLDMGKGKNVGLGRLREALDMNKPGVPFSFRDLPGKRATVHVKNRTDDERIYDEVSAVARSA
jgi:hypothetical protein